MASFYHVGLSPVALTTAAVDRVKAQIRKEAAEGATKAVAPVARSEAAKGAKEAVTPMVLGVGAVAALALLVALRK